MDSVQTWLQQLGLSQYADVFAENAIDHRVLSDLTEADLEKLGILMGHRYESYADFRKRYAIWREHRHLK